MTSDRTQPRTKKRRSASRDRVASATLDALSAAVVALDQTGRIVLANEQWRRFVAENAGDPDLLGEGVSYLAVCEAVRGPESDRADAQAVADAIRAVLDGRLQDFVHEYECQARGRRRWMRVRVNSIAGSGPARVVLTHVDITPRRVAEQDRPAGEQRFQSLIQSAPDALVISTPEGVITEVNREAEQLFGYTAAELIGAPVEMLVPTVQRAADEPHRRTFEALERSRRIGTADHRIRAVRKDGRELFVEITLASLDRDDGPMVVVGIRDVGARWLPEDQLLQSQRHEVVGQLAAAITHDFNNLVQVIGASAEYALSQLPAGAVARREVEVIRNAGLRAASLIARLLAFGGGQRPAQAIDLNAAVIAMEPLLQRLMGPNTTVDIRRHGPVRPIRANPTEIEQLLLNLAANARDAMPTGGTLTIELSTVTTAGSGSHWETGVEHAQMVVRDTGIGMDAATRARIFEAFFSTKPAGKGTGLGLSTVHSIVQRYGGDIQCESDLGQGTVFTVHFPTIGGDIEVAPPVAAAEGEEDVHGHETILVIDDEEFLRSTLTRLLEQRGYRVLAAGSGEEALRLVDALEGPLDLVVTDILMPGMSGWHAVEQIRERRAVRALFTSGSPDEASADQKARFLAKPFSSLSLARTVREVLSAHDEPA